MTSRATRFATLAGLVAGVAAVGVPAAHAAPVPVTTATTFQVTCNAVPSAFSGPTADGKPATVAVTAPPSVAPGETFDIVIDPGTVQIPNSVSGADVKKISRAKIDLPIPANAEFIGAGIADPGNLTAGVPASVIRVDEAGNPSATGSLLRLSGNNVTIGNGPSSSTSSHGGLAVNAQSGATTTLAFPKIRITLKAGASGTIEPVVRTAGAAGAFGTPESFLTFLPQVSHWLAGTIWAPTYCSPRDTPESGLNSGAGPLATIAIEGDPVDPGTGAETSATIDGPVSASTGEKVSFALNVAPETATGTAQFMVDGKPVGDPRPVVRGIARLDLTFGKPGVKVVTAVFTDSDGKQYTTASHVLTVTGGDTGPVDPQPENPGGTGSLGGLLPGLDLGSLGGR
ncbi:Ig-like domain-containing protein [Rhodococcus sp. ACT016]|uniref:Ig-like domain-containing protein n=1 Tax=Rhodococcus sp. ACT016 TaxID=3134808 RepID=UPI003D291F98